VRRPTWPVGTDATGEKKKIRAKMAEEENLGTDTAQVWERKHVAARTEIAGCVSDDFLRWEFCFGTWLFRLLLRMRREISFCRAEDGKVSLNGLRLGRGLESETFFHRFLCRPQAIGVVSC
jgi:hypothetical protein